MTDAKTLGQLQERGKSDLRRWLGELDTAPARSTLTIGIVKQAFDRAESLLRRTVEIYCAASGDGGAAALASLGGGKKLLSKLTFGQYIQLIEHLDSKRQLGSSRTVLSRADRALLAKLSTARNAFAHPKTSSIDVAEIKLCLADVLQLFDSAAIRAMVGQQPS